MGILPIFCMDWEEAWSSFETILQKFEAETRRNQMKFVIVSMPVPFVVNKATWQKQLKRYPAMNGVRWDLEGPEQRLVAFGQRHGSRVVTADEAFQSAPQGFPLFWGDSGHRMPQWHEVMAGTLQRRLTVDDSMLLFAQKM